MIDLVRSLLAAGQPSLSGLGRLSLSSGPTLEDSLALSDGMLATGSPHLQPSRLVDDEAATIVLLPKWPMGRLMDFVGLCWSAFLYMAIRSLRPGDMGQRMLISCTSPTAAAGRLQALFDCAVVTGSTVNSVRFPAAWLGLPNASHDPMIWAIANERVRALGMQAGQTEHQARIRAHVVSMMDRDGRPPRLKQLASATGVSPRTIVRQLAEGGTSFHALVEQERRLRTLSLIGNPALSIRVVAEQLGFPDTSSFGRKFRRWFGESPAHFRRHPRTHGGP